MLLCIILSVSLFLSNPYLLFVMKQRVFVLRDFSDTLLFKQSIYCKVIRCHPGLTGVELPISRTISDSSWSRKVWDAQSEVPCIAIISVLSLEKKNNHERWVPVSHAVRQKRTKREACEKKEREGERESEPATFVIFAFSVSLVDVCMESLEQKFFEMHKGSLNVET